MASSPSSTTLICARPQRLHLRSASSTITRIRSTNIHRPCISDTEMSNLPPLKDEYIGGHGDALAPLGISFIGKDGSLSWTNISTEQEKAVEAYLRDKFGVYAIGHFDPFLVLAFESVIAGPGKLPHTIGGFVPVWDPDGDAFFWPIIADDGGGETQRLDAASYDHMDRIQGPTKEQVAELANTLFFDMEAEAITFYAGTLIIELPKIDQATYEEKLIKLPRFYECFPWHVQWHNGPLVSGEGPLVSGEGPLVSGEGPLVSGEARAREKKPDPTQLITVKNDDGEEYLRCKEEDDTDYIATDGKFYPGALVSSLDKKGQAYGHVSAGVLVRKGTERRLTASYHNWEDHCEKKPELFGMDCPEAQQFFRAAQGDPGTRFGYLHERIGKSDIGLVKMDVGVIFENKFMEFDASAKTFLEGKKIKLNDKFVIDSYPTGKQYLTAVGFRNILGGRRRGRHSEFHKSQKADPSKLPSDDVAYVTLEQGMYATDTIKMGKEPHMRARACGAVLVRCGIAAEPKTPETTILARGEVAGMLHYADIIPAYETSAKKLICYADSFDPLINEGWTIVPPVEESSEESSDENNSNNREEPPTKRQRTN
ncbi:hypothetical protein B0T21DRAFT_417174 [Apiosordaria backusii]|uniref:Uncharacterized protein n=1 Tax=Apiosordaria backusii TaxID=314023 RepID=A0AA40DFT8_9PEZI|nr:hypothetical protein B0T21DRAFT_417174 [Apiosordaria backusii]